MRSPPAWLLGVLLAGCGDSTETVMPDAFEGPTPADDLELVPGMTLPPGDWLLAAEWSSDPNRVLAIPVSDLGGQAQVVFSARRVWSMGAADDGRAIYFSSWDAAQEQRFGITLGDAVQNSFAYNPATQRARYLGAPGSSWENVNDECHELSASGEYLYVCRRYDFTNESFLGWRLGRIKLADRSFEFLRDEVANGPFELNAQDIPGTSRILFEMRARPPASGVAIHTRDLQTGAETVVRQSASRPRLSPDGTRVLFADTTNQSRLAELDLASPSVARPVSPTTGNGSATWSPDGQTIVYTVYDQPRNCDHVERVTWTGSAWSAPERVRDCAQTAEFLADLAWVTIE